ncbi:hypothetical protein LTLLF_173075 [Microtus ochrogaster]|uniref:Uncharacterized protein n=1 Tax=Microtus ochrogaster TaxID=79684 RepID=A0A8J6KPR1_MICOH|nr:hypothetical protein LTLLF_173075 [Microtus ochrogaster]
MRRGGGSRGREKEEEEEEESFLEAKNRVLGDEELLEDTLFVLQSGEMPFLSSELEYQAVRDTLEKHKAAWSCYWKKLFMGLWKQAEKNMKGKIISFTEVLQTSGPLV